MIIMKRLVKFMDRKERIKAEIDRLNQLIKDCENLIIKIPEYMRANQEYALKACKRGLAALELEYMKFKAGI